MIALLLTGNRSSHTSFLYRIHLINILPSPTPLFFHLFFFLIFFLLRTTPLFFHLFFLIFFLLQMTPLFHFFLVFFLLRMTPPFFHFFFLFSFFISFYEFQFVFFSYWTFSFFKQRILWKYQLTIPRTLIFFLI